MAKTRDYMDYLDEQVEIAPANSQEEYQAAETIANVLQDHDLETTIEEFNDYPMGALALPVLTCMAVVALLAAGLTEGAVHFILALVSAVGVGLGLFNHYTGTNLLENVGPASQSQNVVAVHRATGDKVVKGSRPIVIVAHYDTPRESLLRNSGLARYQANLRRASVGCSIALAVAVLFQILVFLPSVVRMFVWIVGLIAALPLMVLAVADIHGHFAPCTLGSNDNKSSVAALLSLANVVRPKDDRVEVSSEADQPRAPRRRAVDEPVAPAGPRVVEVREEVRGVRHGQRVLSTLNILPPTCEIVYQEPKVRVIEEVEPEFESEPTYEPESSYDSDSPLDEEQYRESEFEDDQQDLDLQVPSFDLEDEPTMEEQPSWRKPMPETESYDEYDDDQSLENDEYDEEIDRLDDEYPEDDTNDGQDEYEDDDEDAYDDYDDEYDDEYDDSQPSVLSGAMSRLRERFAALRERFSSTGGEKDRKGGLFSEEEDDELPDDWGAGYEDFEDEDEEEDVEFDEQPDLEDDEFVDEVDDDIVDEEDVPHDDEEDLVEEDLIDEGEESKTSEDDAYDQDDFYDHDVSGSDEEEGFDAQADEGADSEVALEDEPDELNEDEDTYATTPAQDGEDVDDDFVEITDDYDDEFERFEDDGAAYPDEADEDDESEVEDEKVVVEDDFDVIMDIPEVDDSYDDWSLYDGDLEDYDDSLFDESDEYEDPDEPDESDEYEDPGEQDEPDESDEYDDLTDDEYEEYVEDVADGLSGDEEYDEGAYDAQAYEDEWVQDYEEGEEEEEEDGSEESEDVTEPTPSLFSRIRNFFRSKKDEGPYEDGQDDGEYAIEYAEEPEEEEVFEEAYDESDLYADFEDDFEDGYEIIGRTYEETLYDQELGEDFLDDDLGERYEVVMSYEDDDLAPEPFDAPVEEPVIAPTPSYAPTPAYRYESSYAPAQQQPSASAESASIANQVVESQPTKAPDFVVAPMPEQGSVAESTYVTAAQNVPPASSTPSPAASDMAVQDEDEYEYEYVYVYIDENGNEIEYREGEVPEGLIPESVMDDEYEIVEEYESQDVAESEPNMFEPEPEPEPAFQWDANAVSQESPVQPTFVQEPEYGSDSMRDLEASSYEPAPIKDVQDTYEDDVFDVYDDEYDDGYDDEYDDDYDDEYLDAEIEEITDEEDVEEQYAPQEMVEDDAVPYTYDEAPESEVWEQMTSAPAPSPAPEEPAEPVRAPEPLRDPNLLHFDREEDADILERDTSGLDTISDSYDLYGDVAPQVTERERPQSIDDPTWGVSTYQPTRPVMNIARRAALYDLPDPSGASIDPFESEEYTYTDDGDQSSDGRHQEGEDASGDVQFWGSGGQSDWKGGATVRSDLRDAEDPLIIDQDDLQDAILELGDDFLVAHDIWFVATGASEIDHAGIKAFLDEHRRDIRGSFLINLDSVGAGTLSMLVREGLHAPRRADRRLMRMVRDVSDSLHLTLESAIFGSDEREAASCMRSRVRSVTIAGLDEYDQPAYSHTSDDVPENVDPDQVADVVRLVSELIRRS